MRSSGILQTLAASVIMAAALPAAHAQRFEPRWEFLGEAHVDGSYDHDRIVVTAARGSYRAIQLRVENAPIDFDRVLIHFGDGETMPVRTRYRIVPGETTRIIDLPAHHHRRVIESIEFWYHRDRWDRVRPKVVVFGLH